MSPCKPRGGLRQAWWRLVHVQSAFTMHDVMWLAMTKRGAEELASIYEWYAARTTSALRTASAATIAAIGLLVANINDERGMNSNDNSDQPWITVVLGAVVLIALVTSVFQQSELAQLPRERVAAMLLLTIFRHLAESPLLMAPIVEPEDPHPVPFQTRVFRVVAAGFRVVVIVIALAMVIALVIALLLARRADHSPWADAGLVVFALLLLLFAIRIAAEISPTPKRPWCENADHPVTHTYGIHAAPPLEGGGLPDVCQMSLVGHIGKVRLDDYLSDPAIREFVHKHIKGAMDEASPAT